MAYKRTPKQEQAIDLMIDKNEVLLYGGGRAGKTFSFCEAVIVRAVKEDASRHCVLRQVFNDVKQAVWYDTMPKAMDIIVPGLRDKCTWSKSDWFITLPNKSEIWFGGLDDESRWDKILGKEFSTLHFNELSQIDYRAYSLAKTRLAQRNKLVKKIFADCNPPKQTHWSYDYFIRKIDPVTKETLKNIQDIGSLLMNPSDNVDNIDDNYIKMLEALPPLVRDRFLHGLWGSDDKDIFRSEWLKPSNPMPTKFGVKITVIDPACTEKERETDNSCESSIITIGMDYDGMIHEIETQHGMWSYGELKAKAKATYERHKNVSNYIMGVEDVAAQIWLKQDLNEMQIPAVAVPAIKDKITRAISVTDLFEDDRVRVNDAYLVNQLLSFPSGKLKDCVDSFVYTLKLVKAFIKDKPKRPDEDKLRELKEKKDGASLIFWEQYQKEQSEQNNPHMRDYLGL